MPDDSLEQIRGHSLVHDYSPERIRGHSLVSDCSPEQIRGHSSVRDYSPEQVRGHSSMHDYSPEQVRGHSSMHGYSPEQVREHSFAPNHTFGSIFRVDLTSLQWRITRMTEGRRIPPATGYYPLTSSQIFSQSWMPARKTAGPI
jgi:hypothetical protein